MIDVDLRTRIFLRALGLLWALILAVTLASGASGVANQREYARTVYQGQVRTLALQMTDQVLWDDRVALYKLIVEVVGKDATLGYAFLERDGKPYVFTFTGGVPKGLLGLGPFSTQQATVTPFTDQAGGRWLDIAQAVPADAAVLHLGVNVEVLFWQALAGLRGVLAVSGIALLVGSLFAWNIARATTLEVSARLLAEQELRSSRDELSKANEQLAERSANLVRANKELDAFSYSVSHDLRAPLRAIDGFSHVLEEDYASRLDDEGRHCLDVIRHNARHMGNLIDDLLNLSRMSRHEMVMAPVAMTTLAQEVFDEVRSSAPERNIVLRMGELPPAAGDKTLLHQVLLNLVANAVKFTAKRAEAVIEIEGHAEGAENVYRVKDNGAGFDMQYVDKLFGVFQRLHSRDEFDGTGIGLSIVKRIIERHGGRVWAEGTVGEGATFYFALPRA